MWIDTIYIRKPTKTHQKRKKIPCKTHFHIHFHLAQPWELTSLVWESSVSEQALSTSYSTEKSKHPPLERHRAIGTFCKIKIGLYGNKVSKIEETRYINTPTKSSSFCSQNII